MEDKQFEVDVVYRVTVRFAVTAPDPETAERMALEMWQADEDGVGGTEVCELEAVSVSGAVDQDSCGRDCAEVLRFLRDRELVIEQLDEDAFNPTVHDAVSAEEVAIHLHWRRRGEGVEGQTDTPRAARALDRLCAERRVVCFTRSRVRLGEKGEIRLYCTPQHLALLSDMILEEELETAGTAA